jgi:hypothetical protein
MFFPKEESFPSANIGPLQHMSLLTAVLPLKIGSRAVPGVLHKSPGNGRRGKQREIRAICFCNGYTNTCKYRVYCLG